MICTKCEYRKGCKAQNPEECAVVKRYIADIFKEDILLHAKMDVLLNDILTEIKKPIQLPKRQP
jgi:hypothetical protein